MAMRANRPLKAVREDYEAQQATVRDFASGLPEKFLHCRDLGHNWKPYTAGRYRDGGYQRTLRCTRCRTRKVQELSSRCAVMSTRYEHPDGYLLKGLGHITGDGRNVLRAEAIGRLIADTDEVLD